MEPRWNLGGWSRHPAFGRDLPIGGCDGLHRGPIALLRSSFGPCPFKKQVSNGEIRLFYAIFIVFRAFSIVVERC